MIDLEKERKAFEVEFNDNDYFDYCLTISDFNLEPLAWCEEENRYWFRSTQCCWEMWQAAKSQAVPEGFVLVPKELSDDFCKQHANKKIESFKPLWLRENFGATEDELQRVKDHWISLHINRLKETHKEIVEAQGEGHE